MKVIKEVKILHDKSGFGIIHEVIANDGKSYARKTFRPRMVLGAEQLVDLRRRFSREVKVQEKLSSDFCIPIIYSSLEEENPWFLMPIAERTFRNEIIESRIDKSQVNGLSDILNSLEYIHALGYKHRDIKPGNILWHEERWKLADMGLITSDPELTSSFVTKDGMAYGSEPYMAPEQYTDFQNVTHHADIYSFGAILHDIFNGVPRKPYSQLSADGSIGVIIEKCTAEDIIDRFDNIEILRSALLTTLSKLDLEHDDITKETNDWATELKSIEDWDIDKFDSFLIYLRVNTESRNILYYNITSSIIKNLKKLDNRKWKSLIMDYSNWVHSTSFNFDYCDVLIGHLNLVYMLTSDLEIKSSCIFSSAELGRSHNRWYVMRSLVAMCNSSIPDILAERIAIEIYAIGHEAKNNLIACVERINENIDSYHPDIKAVLE